jgi:hypothetical protein
MFVLVFAKSQVVCKTLSDWRERSFSNDGVLRSASAPSDGRWGER